jgi:hypothetical protein
MKIVKIVLALLLIYGAGAEYVNASKQLFTFYDPGIMGVVLLMLILCAWLFGSAVSTGKLQIRSWQFLKYLGLTLLLFVLVVFMSIVTFKFVPEVVKVNGINVDIAEFMNETNCS